MSISLFERGDRNKKTAQDFVFDYLGISTMNSFGRNLASVFWRLKLSRGTNIADQIDQTVVDLKLEVYHIS